MDPVTLSAMGSVLNGAMSGSKAPPPSTSASGGYLGSTAAAIDSSNWSINFGSSGGGFSPAIAAGSVNWLLVAALVAAVVWASKKL